MKSRKAHDTARTVSSVLLLALLLVPAAEGKKKKAPKEGESAVAGTVADREGEKLAGVLVTVTAAAPEGFRGEATTDRKGEFELEMPGAEGEYLVRLTKDGYAPFEVTLEFLPGESKAIDFTLLDEAAGRRQQAVAAYNAGANAFNADDRALAKEKFLAAAAFDPTFAEPLLPLADIFLSEGDYQQAAAHADKYLELKPGEQKAQIIAHEAYRKLGDQARVDELRAALGDTDLSSQLAIQVFNEGAMASQKSDWQLAEEKFLEALELDPSLAAAHAALAAIYYNREAYDESLAEAGKVLELEPENVQGRRYRYLAHEAQGETAETAAALDAYVAVDPEGAAALLYQRADLDFRAGNTAQAEAALLKVLELSPEMARAHYTLGLVYASRDPAKAKEHLLKFIELAPDDLEVASAKEMISYF